MKSSRIIPLAGIAILGLALVNLSRSGQSQVPPAAAPASDTGVKGDRFEFEVVESFDAKYQGDTPGHIGRHGGLGDVHPQVALGDPIYRDEEKVGIVTGLLWTRAQGALEVEFDPTTKARIAVGNVVWLKLGGGEAAK